MTRFSRMAIALLFAFTLSFQARAQNQTISNGTPTAPINFTGAGCRYNWTNSNPGIGLAASGVGNIASFTAVNTGTSPITATITATPVAAGYAYIPNQVDNKISVVDLSTNTVKTTIPVGQTPDGVAITPDGSKVYVTNNGTHSVSVINTASNTVAATIPLVSFKTGAGYVLTDLDYVTIGGAPTAIAISPDGKNVYVANNGIAYTINSVDDSNHVTGKTNIYVVYVIDNTTGDVSMISLGINPNGLCLNRDGTRLYVSNGDANTIAVVDLKNTHAARPIVISGSTNPIVSAGVAQIVATIAEPIDHPFNNPIGVTSPHMMVLTPDGSRIYVTNTNDLTVSAINTATNSIAATISVGQGPAGICMSPDGSKIYVANVISNSVSVISTATNAVIQTYSSFDSPSSVSLSPDGKLLYVNNAAISDLTVSDANSTTGSRNYIDLGGSAFSNGGELGNFITPGSCSGSPLTITITVNPDSPTISASGTLSTLSTSYGTASASKGFSISGTNMAAGILVTPPGGFEVSTDNLHFAGTVTVGTTGAIKPTPVYVRLAATAAAGNYSGDIILSSKGANNVTEGTVSSTISPAKLTITVNNQTRIYGTDNPALTINYAGFVNGENSAKLATQPTIATTGLKTSATGTYPVTASGATSDNYTITYIAGTLTITPALLTVTANDQTKNYGAEIPALTLTYNGFVNGDNSSKLTSPAMAATTATAASPVGTYPITVSGASDANYTISYISGKLTISPAPVPVIASATPSTVVAGAIVTISGENLMGTTAVSFGGTPASSFTVNSSISITAVIAGGSSNGLSVTTAAGTGNFAGLSFVPVPAIDAGGPTTIVTNGSVVLTAIPGTGGYGYQWLKDGAAIGGASSVSYTARQGGNYTVSISKNSVSQVSAGLNVSEVFQLPANNFNLAITGASCRGSANGAVSIKAGQKLNYTATLTGNGLNGVYNFTESTQVNNLAAGTYNLCFTVAGQPNYQQCYTVVVAEPKDISLYATVEPGGKNIILSMDGGTTYHVSLNGNEYTTTNNQLSLPLAAGKNTITVSTDKPCQGVIAKDIIVPTEITAYPNPVLSILKLNLGTASLQTAAVNIYDKSGLIVHTKKYNNISGIVQLDLSFLNSGLYLLQLSSDNHLNKVFKILKQ